MDKIVRCKSTGIIQIELLARGALRRECRRYDLAALLAQCKLDVPPPRDMEDWERMRPVGREV